jgi:hypothetical protein
LIGEIEIIDRLQIRKLRASGEARKPRLLAMGDLFAH